MPFNEVTALRSRVSTAMREELSQNGQTPVYARLSQLRGAIERTIESAVEGKGGTGSRGRGFWGAKPRRHHDSKAR